MPSLYVLEIGSRIEIEHQRILVTKEDEVLLRMPVHSVTQIILIGRIGITTPALHELLKLNIPMIFLNSGGSYLGQITPALSYNLPLRQQQYKRNDDPDFALRFAKNIVAGKIHNQRIQGLRWARREPEIISENLEKIALLEQDTLNADDLSTLLGIEGSAARIYFNIMEKTIDPIWGFANRNRRPPKDPVNALLSFGYTMLTYTMSAALQVVGLDPYLGYYHAEEYGVLPLL